MEGLSLSVFSQPFRSLIIRFVNTSKRSQRPSYGRQTSQYYSILPFEYLYSTFKMAPYVCWFENAAPTYKEKADGIFAACKTAAEHEEFKDFDVMKIR